MLNRVWSFLILAAVASGLYGVWTGQGDILDGVAKALIDMAGLSVEIAIGLIGVMSLWLGLFELASRVGLVDRLARLLSPLFARLMPTVPTGHPALGSVSANLAANMLGLDNAATPLGIRAMQDLETLNNQPGTITSAQSLFLVLNTSSVTLIPVTVLMYRAVQGSASPAAVFLPIVIATCLSTFAGLLAFGLATRSFKVDRVLALWAVGFCLLVGGLVLCAMQMEPEALSHWSTTVGNSVILLFVASVVLMALWQKLNGFEIFVQGAQQGFQVALTIIPYLIALLCAIGMFRASGLMDALVDGLRFVVSGFGWDSRWVDALPTGLMKPLSGSGSRALLLELMEAKGVDSFAARAAAIMQGSTETTFYVIAVYGGAVGIKRFASTVPCALVADGVAIVAAIGLSYLFFGVS